MRKFKCYDDFKRAIVKENIPSIDEQAMVNKIYSKLEYKSKHKSLKIASVILSLIILSTGSIAIGKSLNVHLFNKKGEKVFTLGKLSEEQIKEIQKETKKVDKLQDFEYKYKSILREVEKNTKPNEESIVLIAKEYEQSGIVHSFQNNKYKTMEELKKVTLDKLKLPTIPEGISINDISVRFKVDEAFINNYGMTHKDAKVPKGDGTRFTKYHTKCYDKLYKECISSNKEYIVTTIKLTNEIEYISLLLNFNGNKLEEKYHANNVSMVIGKFINCYSAKFDEKNIEKIKVGNKEAILLRNNSDDNSIFYVDDYNNENFVYEITTFPQSIEDSVIEIIKSLK